MKSLISAATVLCVILGVMLASPASSDEDLSPLSTINGEELPGIVTELEDVSVMLDTINADGDRIIVTKGTRKPGTRVKIHKHEYGGHTCVMTGEITDFVEGREPTKFPAGTCYYMPPNVPMSAANLGTVDAVLVDNFILPQGAPTITILEHSH